MQPAAHEGLEKTAAGWFQKQDLRIAYYWTYNMSGGQ